MYYYCYKITNLLNGKFYIGVHKTENMEDGYFGSGSILKKAISKYGKSNFKKEILKTFDSSEDMYKFEKNIVNEGLLKSGSVYNIKEGGRGGFDYINTSKLNIIPPEKRSEVQRNSWKNRSEESLNNHKKWASIRFKNMHAEGKIRIPRPNTTGFKHSDETRLEMSISRKGEGNTQFGTCWITNGIINKKIKKDDLNKIPEGWNKGRCMK